MRSNQETRDHCELPCQCKTCRNDHNGVCGVDGAGCISVKRVERCPVAGCEEWRPKSAGEDVPAWPQAITSAKLSGSTIADRIRELREAFREEYGVEVGVEIQIHYTDNPHLDKGAAEKLGTEMATVFGDDFKSEHREWGDTSWFVVKRPPYEHIMISLFYKKGGPA